MEQTTGQARSKRSTRGMSRRHAVERAEAYLHANVGAAISVAALSRIVGLSERSLRDAFHELRGLGPKRCTVYERLREVHRELNAAAGRRTTVTSIANRYGFFELGRFAGTYKEMFGEPPSATLRRAMSNGFETTTISPENIDASRVQQ
jgi:transcriptional regulator GlxA family with amidase domain